LSRSTTRRRGLAAAAAVLTTLVALVLAACAGSPILKPPRPASSPLAKITRAEWQKCRAKATVAAIGGPHQIVTVTAFGKAATGPTITKRTPTVDSLILNVDGSGFTLSRRDSTVEQCGLRVNYTDGADAYLKPTGSHSFFVAPKGRTISLVDAYATDPQVKKRS
jgi:hypothetical protein